MGRLRKSSWTMAAWKILSVDGGGGGGGDVCREVGVGGGLRFVMTSLGSKVATYHHTFLSAQYFLAWTSMIVFWDRSALVSYM